MPIAYRRLGRNGLRVSQLCLGTMMFGSETDAATSHRIISKALEQGINFIDTADGYANFQSEIVVGAAIREHRDRWVLATKVGSPRGDEINTRGGTRLHIRRSIEASLKRLGTDHINIYYLHWEDQFTSVAETVRAFGELIAQGLIHYYGISNHRSWKIAEFCRVADELGIDRPIVSQPLYNLANRQIEFEHLDACDYYGLGVVSYSPLARGVLTAKYAPGVDPAPDSRAGRKDRRILQTELRRESIEVAERIKAHVTHRGISAGQFALAWVLNNSLVTAAVVGPRTEAQWDDYLRATDYAFSKADEELVDSLVATGHPSTPGYTDPRAIVAGRRPWTTSPGEQPANTRSER